MDDATRRATTHEPSSTEGRLDALRASDAVQTSFVGSGHHESNEHLALIYETQADQFAAAVPFLRQGLDRGEKCLYVVDDNSKAALIAALRADGIDVDAARESGALTLLTEETYISNEVFTPDEQLAFLADTIDAATEEYPAARLAVEMTCFLDEDLTYDDLLAYEQRYNDLSADADAIALCQYNRTRFPDGVVHDILQAHPHLIADGILTHNVYYTPPEEFFDSDQPAHAVDRKTAMLADLADTETELKRQNERLEEFASIVAHDLRSPLNVAEGQLQLANEEYDSEHLDEIERAHERMETMVEDLLTLARQGDTVEDESRISVGEVAEACWHTVETVNAHPQIETDATVRADEGRLRQLLENLFRNAIDHGGEDVTVTVGDMDDGVYVADDGPGIPAAEREAIFEAGYSTTDDGIGVGLRIVKQIVDAHGWEIRVTASEHDGARFEITGVNIDE